MVNVIRDCHSSLTYSNQRSLLSCHCVNHLVTVYNSAVRLQHFPESWQKAEVVTIPKKGKDPNISQNRRTIGLLSCLGKVYERILLNRLNSQVIANNLVPDEQFGFMPGRSTIQINGAYHMWTLAKVPHCSNLLGY